MKKRILVFLVSFILIISQLTSAYSITQEASSLDALQNILVKNLYLRNPSIDIKYTGNTTGLNNILNNIFIDDEYLKYTISNWNWSYNGYEGSLDINLSATHLLTYEQENKSNIRIKEILNSIIIPNMTVPDKIKAVHDWIILNSQYDLTSTYRTQYNILFQGKAVCQGYALLFDRMMRELNIPTRFVIGDATGPHIWNMVKVNNFWYHIDLTFDDPVPNIDGKVSYNYYMLTEEEITKDHIIKDVNLPISTTKYETLLNTIVKYTNETSQTLPSENPIIQSPLLNSVNILALGNYVQYNNLYGFPFIDNSRTLVPFRVTLVSVGAEVYWEKETSTAIAKYNGITIRAPIGESYILVNGKVVENDATSRIVESRTYLPIRIIMESFGFNVKWEDTTKTVYINNSI